MSGCLGGHDVQQTTSLVPGLQQNNAAAQIEGDQAFVAKLADKERRRTLFRYFVPTPPNDESADKRGLARDSTKQGTGVNVDAFDEEGAAGSCIICFGDFTSGEELCRLPCFHLYHAKCIDEWFDGANHHCCPLCKTDVIAEVASIPRASGSSNGTTVDFNTRPQGSRDSALL
eukprot:g7433.t2